MRVTAAAALVLVLAACGSYDEEATPAEQRPAESTPVETTEQEGATSYGLLRIEHDQERRPADELYRVFRRDRTPDDERAEEQMDLFGAPAKPSEDWKGPDFGLVRPETTRLLLDQVEGKGMGVAAALTTSGAICHLLLPDGGGSCSFPAGEGVEVAAEVGAGRVVIFGLVGDSVTAVDVVVGDVTRRAHLGTNGFAASVAGTLGERDAVVLHRENRDPERIPLS